MGEMTRDQVVALLRARNPNARPDDIVIYADAYVEYQAAAKNIAENGTICAHPRTGAPIENPYLKVRKGAIDTLKRFVRLRVEGLWGTTLPRNDGKQKPGKRKGNGIEEMLNAAGVDMEF